MPNVLLIDAEKEFATPLVLSMQDWGYDVSWTPDGKEGLDKAAAEHPSAIILCVELGKMSGYSICNKLKKDEQLKDIPLIITSREATHETFEQHKKLKTRAEAYLIKPFTPQQLQQFLAELLPGATFAGDLQSFDLQGGGDEGAIALDELSAAAQEVAFDPSALVGAENMERDPTDALAAFDIADDEDPERGDGATRVMQMPPAQMASSAAAAPREKTATKPIAPEPTPARAPAPVAAAKPAPVAKPATPAAAPAAVRPAPVVSAKPVSDDGRRQLETKLQEEKTKAAQYAQEVDKLRAEMNHLRTKAREDSATLRTQVQELTDKFKQEQAALKKRYEESTQNAVHEAATLRQQVKDMQGRAQTEIESLRSQLIETRNQSQDLLTSKDAELVALKKRAAKLESAVEQMRAESARDEKIRERTVKAVDMALQLLSDDDQAA